jgi:hypothetical protein
MRVSFQRLVVLAAAVAVVVSCDGAPTTSRIGSGISGGPSGTAPVVPPAPGSVDSIAPFVLIDTPVANPVQLVNVGDSILVAMRLSDDRALRSVTVAGYKEIGDPNLGTFQKIERYRLITAPVPPTPTFRTGLRDTVIKRYLKPVTPVDTSLGPLVIEAIVEDESRNADTARRVVNIVTGPRVRIISPVNGDSVPVGVPMTLSVEVTHSDGVAIDSIRVAGDPITWPTRLDTTIVRTFPSGTRSVTDTATVLIPANAPLRSRITITATARDVNRNPGSAAPVFIFTRAVGTVAPRVFQTVPPKMERTDSFSVTASGDGIRFIGRVMLDTLGNVIRRDSVAYATPTANRVQKLGLVDSLALQGQRIDIISFAWDNNTPAKIGYSMAAGTTVPNETQASAFKDTTLVAYGRTFSPPRTGVMGDLVVDPNLGNVFLSNTRHNLLEVWDNTGKSFSTSGVPVGAQPWGLFQSRNPDTLLVGNSGATTISRVFIGTSDKTQMREALNRRIRTRDIVIYIVQFIRDPNTGKIRLIPIPYISYSDRPQYVVESQAGRIFYSTRPTSAAEPGTIRWIDPNLPFPEPQQITSYVELERSDDFIFSIFHADSVRIGATPPNTNASDTLYIWDHPYGQLGPTIVGVDSFPQTAINSLRAQGSDAFTLVNARLETLELTDTTFVAASGDRTWIAFGEGNTGGGEAGQGRIMMVNDPLPLPLPGFFSPAISVRDLVHNASEQVFGVAIDSTGLQVTSHGLQTYMAAIDVPFHLRLDGVYDSFDNGAGVAYHPRAKSTLSQVDHRVSFSATASGVIEVIDVAHYNNRGRFITKGNLYGPLRVSGPLPGDNVGLTCPGDVNCVILKIFGLTNAGMVVIDVRASDIKPGF